MSTVFLKIKIKNLADEARTIRKEEKRHSGQLRNDLHAHRVQTVRRAARHTLVAYAYLRGKPYRAAFPKIKGTLNIKEIERMVAKYGPAKCNMTLNEWMREA